MIEILAWVSDPLEARGSETQGARVRDISSTNWLLMPHPFTHPSSKQLLENVKSVFQNKSIFQKRDRHIVFVCGGAIGLYSRSMRKKFLRYAASQLQQFRCFRAETATKDLHQYDETALFINVADFEKRIANIADCIIIFPESAGSIAELAFFCNSNARKKILVINDVHKQGETFINLGPIDYINDVSSFKPTIFLDYKAKNPNFNLVKERLESRLSTEKAKRFPFLQYTELKYQQRFFLIFELINIFCVLSLDGLIECVTKIFGNPNVSAVRDMLSILVAAGYLERQGDEKQYFIPAKGIESFFEYRSYDINSLKTIVIDFFERYHPESYKIHTGR